MSKTPLQQLADHGQSVWLDYLSRQILENGHLAEMMERDAVVGVTSNPTIFQKAIAEGDAYDEQLREVLQSETEPKEVFLALAARDNHAACDELR
ncbi:MAG: transaldolase family protein, partial [Gaiellaceae bacterium]